jgi:hypothetical protein
MDPVTLAAAAIATAARAAVLGLARALVAALWKAYKSKIVLGIAILMFSVTGLAMIIWSHVVTGWSQSALLGFGTSLLIVGTVELGILGVLKKIIDPDHTSGLIDHLYNRLSERLDELQHQLNTPAVQQTDSTESLEPPNTRPLQSGPTGRRKYEHDIQRRTQSTGGRSRKPRGRVDRACSVDVRAGFAGRKRGREQPGKARRDAMG